MTTPNDKPGVAIATQLLQQSDADAVATPMDTHGVIESECTGCAECLPYCYCSKPDALQRYTT
jgi:Na+-translocating ferredoxin:NAD+ oxidoreductase RNF subunit RnfB